MKPMSKDSNELTESEDAQIPKQELDACGLYCPEPVMLLHNKIRDINVGDLLRLTATDPSTTRDVPKFCLYLGHELVEQSQQGDKYVYLIRKQEV
jgi:tRNA 2-thiouridine synthesizing protein A